MKKSVMQLLGCVVACSFFGVTLAHHTNSHVTTPISLKCGNTTVEVKTGDKYSDIKSKCGDKYFMAGKKKHGLEMVNFNSMGNDAANAKNSDAQMYVLKVKNDMIKMITVKKQSSS